MENYRFHHLMFLKIEYCSIIQENVLYKYHGTEYSTIKSRHLTVSHRGFEHTHGIPRDRPKLLQDSL